MKMQLLSLALPMLLLGVAVDCPRRLTRAGAGQSDDPSYLGCFSDPADSRVFDTQYSDSAMTAAVCSALCAGSAFYGTQYSSECWCGDNVDYDANGEGVCDMACSGDASQTCGGFYAMTVYENPDDSGYLGCYSDPADSRIFELVATSDDMTSDICLGNCGAYQYYGTQYSTQCWCGDNAEYDANGAGECDMACSGDASEICGGFYTMSVYENPDVDPVNPYYLGCYSDPADSRIFELVATTDDMTSDICLGYCGAYQYYGTQYSTQCWCGDNAEYDANGAGECDMACSGDASEFCGGFYTMSVYENPDVDPVNPYYLGCYSDPADSRIFELVATSDDMTSEICLGYCGAYQYYGTQYSTQCWCGDNAEYDANGAGECDMDCSGDSSEICGGFYSMSVYENDDVDTVDLSYRGCYSDPADSRIFVEAGSSDGMTAEFCATLCSDSAFYGTQYSTQCWCGDLNARYSENGEGVCDMPCSGDSEETCGGFYSMSVYARDPAYLGCFQDSDSRIMYYSYESDSMTAEACAAVCSEPYYGTQFSRECWCGAINGYDDNGFQTCDMPCTGDSDEICGGSYIMSVYQSI